MAGEPRRGLIVSRSCLRPIVLIMVLILVLVVVRWWCSIHDRGPECRLLTEEFATALDADAARLAIGEVAGYLQEQLGQQMAAYLAALGDAKQIGRYMRGEARPSAPVARRLREGYKVVRMIVSVYDAETARAWLFGTNTRLDDDAPIGVLRQATEPEQFTDVVRAARAFASADA